MLAVKPLLSAGFGAALVLLPLAGTARADAASYIRTLFDATIGASGANATAKAGCDVFAPLARFSAGQHWRGFDGGERAVFDAEFCHLAQEALTRLRQRYPDLSLAIQGSHAGPRDMDWVRSRAMADGAEVPVDWLVGNDGDAPYLADLKVMGISLAIMLRGMAANSAGENPADVVGPWRQVLERALPE